MEVDGQADDECVLPSVVKDYAACPHGPMLLFVKRKDGREYYACSASRDRKLCPFFLFADKKAPSAETLKVWKSTIDGENASNAVTDSDARRMKRVKSLPPSERVFCKEPDCSNFVFPEETASHEKHRLTKKITDRQLRRPMELLAPLEDPKLNAQFIFDDKSVGVLVKVLDELKLHRVICLGAPKIHEALKGKEAFKSYLLDIDARFQRFFSPQTFARFNMFNAHFFSPAGASAFIQFLSSCDRPPVVIVDPPFGGRVQPLFATLRRLSALWLETKNLTPDAPEAKSPVFVHESVDADKADSNLEYLLPVFWAFPYFLENSVQKERPEFRLLDYKIQYRNHPLFHNDKDGKNNNNNISKKGSPIRFLTNVNPALVRLPEPDHRFCDAPGCKRWVARENRHCAKCGVCASKDGSTYNHCDVCQKCVKPSRIHCEKCGRCELPKHFCSSDAEAEDEVEAKENAMDDGETRGKAEGRCFNCGNSGHKRRFCPQNWAGGKRKKQGGKKGGGKKARN